MPSKRIQRVLARYRLARRSLQIADMVRGIEEDAGLPLSALAETIAPIPSHRERWVTCSPKDRAAIHRDLVRYLDGIGDIATALERDQPDVAKELSQRYVAVMRLLDDLGWDADEIGWAFVFTVDPEELVRTIGFLRARATANRLAERDAMDPSSRPSLEAIAAYNTILAQLVNRGADR